jgi:acetyltransferase-like isoleucine patch superfamily enzyme
MRRLLGTSFLALWRTQRRARSRAFSALVSGGFASFGRNTVLETPVRLSGEGRIALAGDVYVGPGSWLQTVPHNGARTVALVVGDGAQMSGGCVISAAASVTVGRNALLARNVYVSDHNHTFGSRSRPVVEQGITEPRPIRIGDGAWLGENVIVGPGVSIGRGAVVGANAVVLEDVPDLAVAVGVPARVVRRYAA